MEWYHLICQSLLLLPSILSSYFYTPLTLSPHCKVSKCEVKLTSEHSAQISTIQTLSISEAECLSKLSNVALPDVFAVYCPDEQFCGIDIQLTHSKALKPLSGKNCSVFAMEMSLCEDLEKMILLSG